MDKKIWWHTLYKRGRWAEYKQQTNTEDLLACFIRWSPRYTKITKIIPFERNQDFYSIEFEGCEGEFRVRALDELDAFKNYKKYVALKSLHNLFK